MKRILEIDGLRFFAIFAVLCVHYRPPFRPALDVLSLGWTGVDLFFVISGFLITSILVSMRDTRHPYRAFYWRRILRIFPPYYLVVLLLLVQVIAHGPHTRQFTWEPLLFLEAFSELAPLHHIAFVVLHHGGFDHQRMALDNHILHYFFEGFGVLWSLSFEEMFYLLWAPLVLRSSRRTLLLTNLAVVVGCPVLRAFGHTASFRECFFFPFRFDTLALGSLLALVFVAHRRGEISRQALQRGLLLTGVLSLFAVTLLFWRDGYAVRIEPRSALSFAIFGYTLLALLFAAVVGLAALHAGSTAMWTRFLRARPLVYVGTISYMVYLIHIPVYVLLSRMVGLVHLSFVPTLKFGLLATGVTLGLAALSWRFYEGPILRFKSRVPAVFEG